MSKHLSHPHPGDVYVRPGSPQTLLVTSVDDHSFRALMTVCGVLIDGDCDLPVPVPWRRLGITVV